jgi:cation diffusion facilitator family transporter
MVSLRVIMLNVTGCGGWQGSFAEENHAFQALLLKASRPLNGGWLRFWNCRICAGGKLPAGKYVTEVAQHLLTDVWTSAGVLAGVGLVAWTGWNRIDPCVALLVAANIVWTGVGIVRRSVGGLMDQALPKKEQETLRQVLRKFELDGIQFHDLRTRQSAAHRFVSVNVLTPATWTVKQGHDLVDRLEKELEACLPNLTITTHLEPL